MAKDGRDTAVLDKGAPLRLVQAMRYLGLKTKGEFAEWAGRSGPAVSDWFNGKTPLPLDVALKIKATKKVSLDWIYAGDDSGQTPTVTAALGAILEKENPKVAQFRRPAVDAPAKKVGRK